ncbi:polysaccharide pyruvyl transferase family protein [Cronbergia sp. UHCC 0137]|uniref:polysaccharide pyruvyl transferase family protein n=1 Tax=Cronbergia sp. UHCC 0137 TaxID=3110239 RepID=UPI002B20488D|nr:polysaccharide pyruvyl transferase family protein [Cronbergia sp. UHCC 0137]MEA5619965.1 polysaccharide pyruvyl transferase family protein [Cronbergia sp. UHCC 0137]
MKIFVETGSYDFGNVGDVAMLQVTVSRLQSLWPDAVIEILTNVPEKLSQLCPKTFPLSPNGRQLWFSPLISPNDKYQKDIKKLSDKKHIFLLEIEDKFCYYFPFLANTLLKFKLRENQQELREIKAFVEAISTSDLIVASGGGYITDLWGEWSHEVLNTLAFATKLGKSTAILGHGIGPIQNPRFYRKAKSVLPSLSLISIREKKASLPLLDLMGVSPNRIITTGDDAIELAYNARNPKLGNGIGINLRVANYSNIGKESLGIVRSTLHDIAKKKDSPLVPVPILRYHIDPNAESDITTIQQIIAGFDNVLNQGNNLDTPLKVIEQVSHCRIVITGSYHAGVFALAQGIPVVSLVKSQYYIDKFQGLADQFGVGCDVILLDDEKFAQKLASSIHQLWEAAEVIRPQLLEAAQKQIELGKTAYKRLYEIVQKNKNRADR